jgi:hypothetical protein
MLPTTHASVNAAKRAVAGLITRWKEMLAGARESAAFNTVVADIAHDLGLSADELQALAAKGDAAAKELPILLEGIRISLEKIAEKDPLVLRDLQRVCSTCDHKRQCDRDIAAGKLADNYERYCPNAYTLEALKRELTFASD